ncbi:YkgJ family cysteine cluster protein [Niveibacterium sp. SC-1]|uniref:YkgJ family cysteine cluster protein n=1 Tax=Niveibacterium sp. SC-1 TaxID=3135646 RepID=UPI00311F1D5D
MSVQPLRFFQARHAEFSALLAAPEEGGGLLASLLSVAFRHFEDRAREQCRGAEPIDCRKGCAICCTLRVTATAPEVLHVARHLREDSSAEVCVRLVRRLLAADGLTRDLDEQGRVELRHRCPFIEQGACVIYAVRPLACRGHASHSRRACLQAAAGRSASVPYSVAHRDARSLVQNALQSALRDCGLGWVSYELNHALRIALSLPEAEGCYLRGEDLFADAAVHEVPAEEMADGFELIKRIWVGSFAAG